MSKQTYSLIHEAAAMMGRLCARYAGAPLMISQLAKNAYRLGDLDDEKLVRHRQALRLIHKFIGRALAVADDHVERNRLAKRAAREAAEVDASVAEQVRHAKRAAPKNPPPLAGEGDRPQDGGGGAA